MNLQQFRQLMFASWISLIPVGAFVYFISKWCGEDVLAGSGIALVVVGLIAGIINWFLYKLDKELSDVPSEKN